MKRNSSKGIFFLLAILFTTFFLGGSTTNLTTSNEDDQFYLSNYTTFAPGAEAKVNVYSYNASTRSFKLKLLKIEDPISFFSRLDATNSRYAFDIWGKDKALLLKYTRLIKEWDDKTLDRKNYNYRDINIGVIDEPGIYVVQAIRKDKVAYCGLIVTNYAMVSKNNSKQVLAYIADAKTGEFVKKARFDFYQSGKKILTENADKDGLLFKDLEKIRGIETSNVELFGFSGDEVILSNPYFYFNPTQSNYLTAYIYTNQPVYRPGQEVKFKAIFRNKKGNEIVNAPNMKFGVSVKSPKNKEVYSGEITSNEFGSTSGEFLLDGDADLGYYSVIFTKDGMSYYGSFTVEEYKKPEYKVNVLTDRSQYSKGDKINATISADYYFGSPVKNATVNVKIFRQTFWRPWWYWSEWAWFYRGFNSGKPYWGSNQEQIHQQAGELNEDGKFELNYKINTDKNTDFQYTIVAEVTDASRRVISGSSQCFVTRGSFTISTSPEKYFFEKGKEVRLKVNASDFSDKPVETDFRVIINYPDDKLMRMSKLSDTIYAKTNPGGAALVTFKPKGDLTGYYNYSVIAFDEREREISASSSFYVGDLDDYYYQRTNAGLEIVTDKDSYEKGDSLIAFVFIPYENQELLLTTETDKILSYKKLTPEKNVFEIREKLTDKFSPSFNISVSFIHDRMLFTTQKLVGVLAKDKFLNIAVNPSKPTYKPGENASYQIVVKDYLGNPVKNTELSFGIIDESIYAIKEDETQPIETFFYSPQYSYIPIYNSLQYGYFSSYSRTATYIDKNFFSYKEDNKTHSGKLFGKMKLAGEEKIPDGVFIVLTGEKYYYTTKVDSLGNYRIENVAKGNYQLFVSAGLGGMFLIDEMNIDGEKKYDIQLSEDQKQQIEEMIVRGLGGMGQTEGIVNTNQRNEAPAPTMMEDMALETAGFDGRMKKESDELSGYVKADVRTNFVDALIWKAHVVTDSEGKAKVEFKIPDNLTTWRTTVRGITKQTDVGQKIDKFISRKDLLVRMETPRFFRQDDEIVISTIVHNYLSSAKQTRIEFTADKLNLVGSKINSKGFSNSKFSSKKFYEIEIPANSELRIDWKVRVDYPSGEAMLKAEALTDEESDAMEVKVPIIPNGIKIIDPLVADYSGSNVKETLQFEIPFDVDLRTAQLSFTLNPSLAGTMLKALDDLAGYPYGCVEQTMSRFLPTIIVANTFKEIKVPLKSQTIEELPKYVEAGLKRLYDFQHSDGGWGWWTNDKTHPYMTAYVIYGMALAKQAGYDIDESIYFNGLNNLKNQIENAESDIDETTLAYMIFSLSTADAGIAKSDAVQNILEILLRKDLKSYPLSLIAITYKNMNDMNAADKVIAKIKEQVNEESSFAFWGGEEWHYRWQNDNVQGTAFALKAILNVEGNSELLSKAVRWLLKQKHGYSWRSTQETSVVLFALTDYLKITKELEPDFSVKVFLNGKEVAQKSFNKNDVYKESVTYKFNAGELKKGKNTITVEKSGNGKLYFSGASEFFTEDFKSVKNDRGFKVKREYYVLESGEKDGRIIYYKKKFNGTVTSGQDIFVKTFVESGLENMEYFILEDMLPSGFEIVKDMDKYFIDGENNYQTYYDYYYDHIPWRWHYADREYRDEKVAFFVTYCGSKMEFSYIMKAQIPGSYQIMPAQGYLMYYPELNGFSNVVDITVKDLN